MIAVLRRGLGCSGLKRRRRALGLVGVAGVSSLLLGARAPVDDAPEPTIREIVKSIEATSAVEVSLERLAVVALDALAADVPCLRREASGGSVRVACADRGAALGVWPPPTSDAVVTLLSAALRLDEPDRVALTRRVRALARALAAAAGDPFTAYVPPDLVAAFSSNNTARVAASSGIDVWPRVPGRIRNVRPRSSAEAAGVKAGDLLVAIDGESVEGLSFTEVSARLQGAADSPVRLRLGTGEAEREVRVLRTLLPTHEIVVKVLAGGIAYVRLPSFTPGCAQQVATLLGDREPTAVVLDLRHNGGGLVPEGIALADLFLTAGPIAGVRARAGRPQEDFVARASNREIHAPLAVLVDGQSASASELVAGALQRRKRAVIVGVPTAGKGSVQRQIRLPDGGVLKVTAGFYVGPTGEPLDERGVVPDRVLARSSSRTVQEGADPLTDSWVLSALDALQIVGGSAPTYPAGGRLGSKP